MVPSQPFAWLDRVTDIEDGERAMATSSTSPRFLLAACLLSLAGCGGSGGGSPASGETGHLKLSITDAPLDDATNVVVQFHAVAFKREGAPPERIEALTPSPRQLDLMQYQQGRTA